MDRKQSLRIKEMRQLWRADFSWLGFLAETVQGISFWDSPVIL